MPFINGKFYLNPIFGAHVERARQAEAERGAPADEPQPPDEDAHWVTLNGRHVLIHESQAGRAQHHRAPAAESKVQIANRIYNETSGLRPTTPSGPGSTADLHNTRVYIAGVIRNGQATENPPPTASNQLAQTETQAIKVYPPARAAYQDSVDAAQQAITGHDPTGGATHFYLDYGQPKPPWALGEAPVASFGPFVNTAGGGDVPKGARVIVRVYR